MSDTPIGTEAEQAAAESRIPSFSAAPVVTPADTSSVSVPPAVAGVIHGRFTEAEERISAIIDDLASGLRRDLLGK